MFCPAAAAAALQFSIYYEGHYEPQLPGRIGSSTRIVLKCFADNPDGSRSTKDVTSTPDGQAAAATLAPLMRKLDVVGVRPWPVLQRLLKLLFGLPYDPDSEEDIKGYVRRYAESHLLTEQVSVLLRFVIAGEIVTRGHRRHTSMALCKDISKAEG
jgi:hypothetical protein